MLSATYHFIPDNNYKFSIPDILQLINLDAEQPIENWEYFLSSYIYYIQLKMKKEKIFKENMLM